MAAKEKNSSRWSVWLAPILFLLAAVGAAVPAPASASMASALETRAWEKSSASLESRQSESLQLLNLHQQNDTAGYDDALGSPLAAESGADAAANAATQSQRMTADQQALKELVDEATNGGRTPLSADDANTVNQWAQETNYPGFRAGPGDVSSPSNWPGGGGQPHIHLPGVGSGHIPVVPGVTPVTP